jgi:hypothetical protein
MGTYYHSIADFIASFYHRDSIRPRKNKGGITKRISTNAQVKNSVLNGVNFENNLVENIAQRRM